MVFTLFMPGRHFESVILYCVGQFKIEKMVFRASETIVFYHAGKKRFGNCPSSRNSMSLRLGRIFFYQLCHKHAGSSSKIEPVMGALCDYASIGSFAPISNDFRWFHHGICLFGQKRSASMFAKLSVWSQVAGCLRQQSGS